MTLTLPETLPAFDFPARTRIVFDVGAIDRLGALAASLGASRALLVSDAGVIAAGHVRRAIASLEAAGIAAALFEGVHENPTNRECQAGADAFVAHHADLIIGLGGGSSLDTAKGAAFLASNGGRMSDYRGHDDPPHSLPPIIAIPTTAGTGSEVQSYALISDVDTHVKMACGASTAAPRIALLDPELTLSQPTRVAACTGIDAMIHAIESAVTLKRNAMSAMLSLEAFRLLAPVFARVLASPNDLQARGSMLLGAALAGLAIENSMLGGAHAAANPLTARFDLTHGHAVGLMAPHVIRYNAGDDATAAIYASLAACLPTVDNSAAPVCASTASTTTAAHRIADHITQSLAAASLPSRLRDVGVTTHDVDALAGDAESQWTARFNPRPLAAAQFVDQYQAAW